MARTTSGWQCPVEQTAIPALKSGTDFHRRLRRLRHWPLAPPEGRNAYTTARHTGDHCRPPLAPSGPGRSVTIFGSLSVITCGAISCPPAYLQSRRRGRVIWTNPIRHRKVPVAALRCAVQPATRSPHRLARASSIAGMMASLSSTFRKTRGFVRDPPRELLLRQSDIAGCEPDRIQQRKPERYSDRRRDPPRIRAASTCVLPRFRIAARPTLPSVTGKGNSLIRSRLRCACTRPSKVKFICLRYGTETSRYRMAEAVVALLQKISQGKEVSLRFRHLLVFDKKVLTVKPEAENGLPVTASLCAISFS